MRPDLALVLVLLLLTAASLRAADVEISWDTIPGATEYRIHQSTDLGATWTQVASSPTLPITVTGVPSSGLVLFRCENRNANGGAIRAEVGLFYNGEWDLPPGPASITTP